MIRELFERLTNRPLLVPIRHGRNPALTNPADGTPLNSIDIKLVDLTFLRGPSRWSYKPAMEALVDIGALEESPSNLRPDVIRQLLIQLPGLRKHGCSYEVPGGFVRRLEEGTWPAHILEHVTIELLALAGFPVGFGRARSATLPAHYHVVVRSPSDEVTRHCFEAARGFLVNLYRGDEGASIAKAIEQALDLVQERGPPASIARLSFAAERARIPARTIEGTGLVVLGYGSSQRRYYRGATDKTSAIAEGITRDKSLLHGMLKEAGVPVANAAFVRNLPDAIDEARELGGSLVIKAARSTGGAAVTLDPSVNELTEASARAFEHSSTIAVERLIPGEEFELLTVGDRVVSAISRESVLVQGDGRSSLEDLVRATILDRLRGPWAVPVVPLARSVFACPRVRATLKIQSLDENSVLGEGQTIHLSLPLSTGGKPTTKVDPSVTSTAITASRIAGLDIAKVTIVSPHLGAPLESLGGVVLSVNPAPDLVAHRSGTEEDSIADALLEHLRPTEQTPFPIIAVGGARDTTEVVDLIRWFLHLSGRKVGAASRRGTSIGDRVLDRKTMPFAGAERLLLSPEVDSVVFESTPVSLLREGLPCARTAVSVVTAYDGTNQLSAHGLAGQDAHRHLMRTLVDVVLPDGVAVLALDDPGARDLAEFCDGRVYFFGSLGSRASAPAQLRRPASFFLSGGAELVIESEGATTTHPISAEMTPSLWLPALASAVALGLPLELALGAIHPAADTERDPRSMRPRAGRASRPDL